ncbi:MAG: EsaB/YukD family protein, partial [Actinomycetota bacterium]|nr:EsaB/YukD family protein [Actinomycetota bacterium]
MSDSDYTANGSPPTPPPELLARAAEILGVDETPLPRPAGEASLLMLTVAGPNSRQVLRLPADVPVGRLAGTLGDAVGVKVVARISVRNGEVISPSQTLAEVGVRAGSVLVVDAPDAPGLPPGGPEAARPSGQQYWSKPLSSPRTTRSGAQWAILAGTVVAIVVISMLLGAALFGGTSTPANKVVDPVSVRAATAWVNGTPFGGPRLRTVPVDLA